MNGGLSKIRSVHTYVLKGFILVVSTVHKICRAFWEVWGCEKEETILKGSDISHSDLKTRNPASSPFFSLNK